ncbi:MAG: DUF2239 family protein [Deltaproteobacteria bacterium]|nr:DUF2239 family protein [Deltaproteobacteria bacterium]
MDASGYVAFEGWRRLATGTLAEVVTAAKPAVDRAREPVLIFDSRSEQVELDFRGSLAAVLARLPSPAVRADRDAEAGDGEPRGRGRPKLGVTAREVTLLPRHWEWLAGQPGGASAALRRLVEAARKANEDRDRLRRGRDVLYRFCSAMAGDAPGFEEASRALFAGDRPRFETHTAAWPPDVRAHALELAAHAFEVP